MPCNVDGSHYHGLPFCGVNMIAAFAYARVSSREQEREGYSIPAQRKLFGGYARTHDFHIEQEFIDVESAKNPGRKELATVRCGRPPGGGGAALVRSVIDRRL